VSEDRSPSAMNIETHEEFVQHIERGSTKIRVLSLTTMVVAVLLVASYAYQIALPLVSGTTTVDVNLADPTLMATEAVLLALALVWLYVAARDYSFTRRLTKQIREARRLESELIRKYGLREEPV
jgi:uncharacterized membrane protein YedE/YeeE